MNKTKRNKNILCHEEVIIRTVTQDSIDFTAHILENRHNKLRSPIIIILRVCIGCILYCAAIMTSFAMNRLGISEWVRIAYSVVTGYAIVIFLMSLKSRYINIKKADVIEAVADTTFSFEGDIEKESWYSFGENGFSTNAYDNQEETFFHRYKNIARAIECEKGIIMIYQNKQRVTHIYCIPSRFIDDESACFITERLKKKTGRRFFSDSMMEIHSGEKLSEIPTERNENK